jgi:hypothetical protein
LNPYAYPENPVGWVDPLGLDACYVHFPDYPVTYNDAGDKSTWLGGHAGVLTYDKEGTTRYYEYGRYPPKMAGVFGKTLSEDKGNVRRVPVANLKMDSDGKPTSESMAALEAQLSSTVGQHTKAKLTCNADSDPSKVHEHVEGIANNPNRDKYSWTPFFSNHCRSFAKAAVKAGEKK